MYLSNWTIFVSIGLHVRHGATGGNLAPTGIGGLFCNFEREVLDSFSKSIGVGDSTKVEVLAILQALRIFSDSYY